MPPFITRHNWRAIWSQVAASGGTGLVKTAFDIFAERGWTPIYADTDAHTLFYQHRGLVPIGVEPERATVPVAHPPRRRGLLRGKRC